MLFIEILPADWRIILRFVNTLNIQFLGLVKIWPKLFAIEKKKDPREESAEAFKNAEQKSNESYNQSSSRKGL